MKCIKPFDPLKPYLAQRQPPEGATHCCNPDSPCDPLFYRVIDGELEIWGIAVGYWIKSKHTVDYINDLWVLDK